MREGRKHLAVSVLVALVAAGCEGGGASPGPASDAGTSPNASILPAPLAEPPEVDASVDAGRGGIAADALGRLLLPDAGAPEPMQPEEALPPEAPATKELPGISLEAAWRWRDVPAPQKAPEVSFDGIREAQKATALSWTIALSESGRMRVVFSSHAQPLPRGAELRARADRWGHIVLWPNATSYRVVPPGALRAVIGERRVDVTPTTLGTVHAQGEGHRLGVATHKIEIVSSLGSIKLELGKMPEAGEGGALLCRALVEIAGIDPKSLACQSGDVPVSAQYSWQEGGGIGFEVTAAKRADLPSVDMLVPPGGAQRAAEGLPTAPGGVFLTREQLFAFRTAPIALPGKPEPSAPGEGFVAVNHADMLMYFLLDGVPAVAVPAGADRYVIGPVRGRYVASWRSFLGDRIVAPSTVELPARISYGAVPDAGAPDAGWGARP